jgi:hypothetical protein
MSREILMLVENSCADSRHSSLSTGIYDKFNNFSLPFTDFFSDEKLFSDFPSQKVNPFHGDIVP